ncbi:MAG TPA: agmatine deiminase family protein [Xanthomonadaceae bacterium]|nr:agmatine deiminase family protein [Xanthomonadaceae bacterium]
MSITRIAAWLGLLFGCASLAAQGLVPEEFLAGIQDDEPTLPRGFTREERDRWRLPELDRAMRAPPPVLVRAMAEYESNRGLLIRWGSQNSVLTEMTVAVTTLDSSASMYIVVSGPSLESSARSTLQGAGADLSRVHFLTAPSDSVWIRDYGPRYVDQEGELAIVDHTYNRPRPNDNQVPDRIAQLWGQPQYDLPLVHGGGNFHLFANREALMTNLILDENPGVTAQQVRDYYAAYQGLDVTLVGAFPTSVDSTQHIDMWMLPVSDETIIIGEYDAAVGGGVPRQVTEATATLLEGRGYTVLRTPGWRTTGFGGAHYTYTNAVIVNDLVMICRFNGYEAQNAQARAVFEAAFPDRQIYAVDCSGIISLAGAIHCIVMHVPEPIMSLPEEVFRDGFEGGH